MWATDLKTFTWPQPNNYHATSNNYATVFFLLRTRLISLKAGSTISNTWAQAFVIQLPQTKEPKKRPNVAFTL